MKNSKQILITVIITLVLTAIWTASGLAAEKMYNARLLLHGVKSFGSTSNWGMAGWAVLPNYAADPSKALFEAGPRYGGKNYSVELMIGAMIIDRQGKGLIDLRVSYDKLDPWHFWGEIMYFEDYSKYTFAEVNYRIGQIGLIGLETENDHIHGPDNLSLAPHVVIPLSSMVLQGAYQFHSQGGDQVWFRTVINF